MITDLIAGTYAVADGAQIGGSLIPNDRNNPGAGAASVAPMTKCFPCPLYFPIYCRTDLHKYIWPHSRTTEVTRTPCGFVTAPRFDLASICL